MKWRALARIVEIVFSEFEAVVAGGKSEAKRQGKILKVILFGSCARGRRDGRVSGSTASFGIDCRIDARIRGVGISRVAGPRTEIPTPTVFVFVLTTYISSLS